jgi:hypothetical protein
MSRLTQYGDKPGVNAFIGQPAHERQR